MEKICDGGRRPVHKRRHQLQTSKSGHSTVRCPVCKKRVSAKMILGTLEIVRHERK